jgi:hypothetical protein
MTMATDLVTRRKVALNGCVDEGTGVICVTLSEQALIQPVAEALISVLAIPEGTSPPRISLDCSSGWFTLRFEIKSSGRSIPPEARDLIVAYAKYFLSHHEGVNLAEVDFTPIPLGAFQVFAAHQHRL